MFGNCRLRQWEFIHDVAAHPRLFLREHPQNPQPFVSNTRVLDLMQREGTSCLPIVLVNGEELGHGAYPRREELARAAGLVASASQIKPRIRLSADKSCTPGSGCC